MLHDIEINVISTLTALSVVRFPALISHGYVISLR